MFSRKCAAISRQRHAQIKGIGGKSRETPCTRHAAGFRNPHDSYVPRHTRECPCIADPEAEPLTHIWAARLPFRSPACLNSRQNLSGLSVAPSRRAPASAGTSPSIRSAGARSRHGNGTARQRSPRTHARAARASAASPAEPAPAAQHQPGLSIASGHVDALAEFHCAPPHGLLCGVAWSRYHHGMIKPGLPTCPSNSSPLPKWAKPTG
jgi:hypothetical protein